MAISSNLRDLLKSMFVNSPTRSKEAAVEVVVGNDVNINIPVGTVIGVEQDTHDDLNANANIQVGNVDVSGGNPVPVSFANAPTTVDHFNGTVGTTAIQIPSSAGDDISEVLIHNTTSANRDLLISFDGGTTFKTLTPDANIIWNVKEGITQIHIKGSAAATSYEIVMNRRT